MKYTILVVNILLSVGGQFLLKSGIKSLGDLAGKDLIMKAIFNPMVIGGVFCYGLGMLTWFLVLSKFDLSVAYPSLSFGYILVLLISWKFLGEQVNAWNFFGIALIMGGIYFLFKR